MRKIVFTGGGTGGHIIPNLALIDELIGKAELHYIGTQGMEKTLTTEYVKKKQLGFHEITAHKFKRKISLKNLLLPFKLLSSIKQAKRILRAVNPDIVFSKGGYVSLPIVVAAKRLKIPCVLHESDMTMGLANKLSVRCVSMVFTTFPGVAAKIGKKAKCVGSPLRRTIYNGNKQTGLQTMGFDGKRKILTIVGGSQGASNLNKLISDNADILSKMFDVFVVCGKGKADDIKSERLHVKEFVSNINDIYAATDYVVSRAGSNAVCELVALGKPTLLVPLVNCSRGEQVLNADYFTDLSATLTAEEVKLDAATLNIKLAQLVDSEKELKSNMLKISIDGTSEIVDYLLNSNLTPYKTKKT